MGVQRRQGAFQSLDRVGPIGGQVLGGSTTDPLKLQGVLEFSNPVITRLAGRSATRGPGSVRAPTGWSGTTTIASTAPWR
jgi:hypothetical protein